MSVIGKTIVKWRGVILNGGDGDCIMEVQGRNNKVN